MNQKREEIKCSKCGHNEFKVEVEKYQDYNYYLICAKCNHESGAIIQKSYR